VVISWRDLLDDDDRERETNVPPRPRAPGLGDVLPGGDARPDPASVSPNLAGLFVQQDQLRQNMAVLSGQEADLTDRDAARFALQSRQERVADYERWLARQDRRGERSRAASRPGHERRRRAPRRTGPTFRGRELQEAGTPPRSSLDRPRTSEPPAERNGLRDELRSLDNPLRDRLRVPDPRQAIDLRKNKVVDDWTKKRDQARQRTEEIRSYKERSTQILDLLEGGSGSLEERAERALEKLTEKKMAEAKDEARRQRAVETRRQREEQS